MPRPAKMWKRGDRPGWFATIAGHQVLLGLDRAEAEREFHRRKLVDTSGDRSRLLVRDLCELYLEWASSRVKPKTHASYRGHLRSWVAYAGAIRGTAVKPFHVTAWFDSHPAWGSSYRHTATSVVKVWSRWCKEQGYWESDPLRDLRRPKMLVRVPAHAGAIDAMIDGIACARFRDLVLVLRDIGCRPGELSGLEASTIAWDERTATVAGKTGPRVVSLTERAVEILRAYAARYPVGPILRNSRGRPWKDKSLQAQFARSSQRAGVHVTAYHCRHDFWSRANKAGVDSIVIAKQMGHTDLSMLAKVYAHVSDEAKRDAVDRAKP